jgi:type II secretory pathway component PulF
MNFYLHVPHQYFILSSSQKVFYPALLGHLFHSFFILLISLLLAHLAKCLKPLNQIKPIMTEMVLGLSKLCPRASPRKENVNLLVRIIVLNLFLYSSK